MNRAIIAVLAVLPALFSGGCATFTLPAVNTVGHISQQEADELLEETSTAVVEGYREGIDRASSSIAFLDQRNAEIRERLRSDSLDDTERSALMAELYANEDRIIERTKLKQTAAVEMRSAAEQLIVNDSIVLAQVADSLGRAAEAEYKALRTQRASAFGWFAGVLSDDPIYDRDKAYARDAEADAEIKEAQADLIRAQVDEEEGVTLSDLWNWAF
ncbi:MAG: hypothetical protein KDD44_06770 [Bdellovibrionales bacterium]|nr:hypothetical protein [Bdellovibrionales bacterium]